MTPSKRLADVLLALTLALILVVPFTVLVLYLLWREGRPVFYVAERMRAPGRAFALWKLRTMSVVPAMDCGATSSSTQWRPAGKKSDRLVR